MPIYEYQCRKCKAHTEVFQKVNDKPPVKCRKCGGRLERMTSAPAIQFKGSGFYATDYATKGKKAEAAADKAEATSSSDKTGTKETSPAKKTSEKASAPKSPSGD